MLALASWDLGRKLNRGDRLGQLQSRNGSPSAVPLAPDFDGLVTRTCCEHGVVVGPGTVPQNTRVRLVASDQLIWIFS